MPVDLDAYWSSLAPRLEAHIAKLRDRQVESVLVGGLALYSYVVETFSEKLSKGQDVWGCCHSMLVHLHDVSRGLIAAQAELSTVAAAALLRISFEVRCTQLFIHKSPAPAQLADRYRRFAQVERLRRDLNAKDAGLPLFLRPGEEAHIRSTCAEWITPSDRLRGHWSAEEDSKSLKQIADAVGLGADYVQVYGLGSKFIHGSALLGNHYGNGPGGALGALSNTRTCSKMALLAAQHCVLFLKEAADFYGVPWLDEESQVWFAAWCQQVERLNSGG